MKTSFSSVKKCPQCKSTDLTLYAGANLGQWQCKECSYIGVLIIEEDIEDSSVD